MIDPRYLLGVAGRRIHQDHIGRHLFDRIGGAALIRRLVNAVPGVRKNLPADIAHVVVLGDDQDTAVVTWGSGSAAPGKPVAICARLGSGIMLVPSTSTSTRPRESIPLRPVELLRLGAFLRKQYR